MVLSKKGLMGAFLFMLALTVLTACGESSSNNDSQSDISDYATEITENPIVTITMESDEKIVIELEPKTAPNTVANFISLVKDGFYDGLIFHRVIPGFIS